MKYCKLRSILLITIDILVIGLIFLAGCTRGTPVTLEVPTFEPFPIWVTADQLYAEYIADEAAANAKYKGEEVWFSGTTVGNKVYFPNLTESYIMLGQFGTVRCMPQDPSQLDDIGTGYMVDIVGVCEGMSERVVIVKISRIDVIKLDIFATISGEAAPPEAYEKGETY